MKVSAEVLDQMREWVADCVWEDLDPQEALELPEELVLCGVARFYEGGLPAFLRDCGCE